MAVFIGLIHGFVARQNVGCFKTRWHGITGDVFVENSYELTIENFNYDGLGPGGVYFNVGMSYQLYLSEVLRMKRWIGMHLSTTVIQSI